MFKIVKEKKWEQDGKILAAKWLNKLENINAQTLKY